MNESGTTARFILPLILFRNAEYTIVGNNSICERPIVDLIEALNLKATYLKK